MIKMKEDHQIKSSSDIDPFTNKFRKINKQLVQMCVQDPNSSPNERQNLIQQVFEFGFDFQTQLREIGYAPQITVGLK